jgi:O-antigen/teichoic acid export membrane protein
VEKGLAAIAVLYLPFAVGLWVEAEGVLRLLFGEAYAARAGTAARWLAVGPLLFAVGYVGGYGLLARERRWVVTATTAAAVVVNLTLNLVLIPPLAETGAAIATIASYAVKALLVLWVLGGAVGFPRLHRSLAVPAAAAAVMGAFLVGVRTNIAVEVLAGAVLYGMVWYVLARRWAPGQISVVRSMVRSRGAGEVTPTPDAP